MRFFHCHQPRIEQKQTTACESRKINDLGDKIFFEFHPHKAVPNPLPHNYHLNRITTPLLYIRLITDRPDLQQHLIEKIINLVNLIMEKCQVLKVESVMIFQQDAARIAGEAVGLARQVAVDLSRPKGFQIVTGERVKLLIEQALMLKEEVLALIAAQQENELKAMQRAPSRVFVARGYKPMETQTTISAAVLPESWSPSVSAAAKNLRLAVAQKEVDDKVRGSSMFA